MKSSEVKINGDSKLGIIFPGQGSQYVGMGKELCAQFKIAKETFQEASDALHMDLEELCFEGSMKELTKTINSQPAILTYSIAAFRIYMQEIGIEPYIFAGHSLGEITALVCAGSIKFKDAVKIVRERGRFMQEAVPIGIGSMIAVSGVSVEKIEELCIEISHSTGKTIAISNYNSLQQIVVSGNGEGISIANRRLTTLGGKVIPLNVSAPFHCDMMKEASERLLEELKKYAFYDLQYPVISNVNGLPYKNKETIAETLATQVVAPVQWVKTVQFLEKEKVEPIIEIAPKSILKALIKRDYNNMCVESFEKSNDLIRIEKTLTNHTLDMRNNGSQIMLLIDECLTTAICTKNCNWNNEEYQEGVVKPYRNIKQMQSQLKKDGMEPLWRHGKDALDMLISVLKTKKVDAVLCARKYNEILNQTGNEKFYSEYINTLNINK